MLLKTRFYLPPLRQNGVIRHRLLKKLQMAHGGSVVLVSAPAGYGKTTLVSQWLHLYPHTFAWLLLGQTHNSPQFFWHYLITALNQIMPQLGNDALESMEYHSSDFEDVVVSLLNDLDRCLDISQHHDPVSLVLDDFHWIKDPILQSQFRFFLDHLPQGIRVVMTSRDVPEIGVANRLAKGLLLQLGVDDLRFDEAESLCFFQETMSLQATEDLIHGMTQKTEGWVAGLQLVAISMRQPHAQTLLSEEGLDRHISDYLLEEVFSSQPEALKQFLLITAIPKRFCAGLCNAMLESDTALGIIEQLEKKDLFLVPLDNHRTWYRYHELFRQFLLQRLMPQLKKSANYVDTALNWLQENGKHQDAVELCLQCQDWERAFDLLLEWYCIVPSARKIAYDDNLEKVRDWFKYFPAEKRDAFLSLLMRNDAPAKIGGYQASNTGARSSLSSFIVVEGQASLTSREQSVLDLLSQGIPNKAIADNLHISLNTLKVHIRNLYQKMGVENRQQALLKIHKQ